MDRRELLRAGVSAALISQTQIPDASAKTSNSDDARRAELYGLLGKLPPRARKASARLIATEDRGAYTLEKLVLDLNGIEAAPAFFAKPKGESGHLPTVLFNHSHGGGYHIGKHEFVNGREYMSSPPYADFLTSLGYNALCFDTWMFGERATRTELDTFKDMLWHGRVLWGMMVYDSLMAVDYLVSRPDVDAQRLATVGMSMGSSMAQWLGALDSRVKVIVDICCLTDWDTLLAVHGLEHHGIYYYVPDLLNHFTTAQMNALSAPRAHLALAGNQDPLTPVEGLVKVDEALQKVYASAGHPENWKLLRYDGKHFETPVMREEIHKWLIEKL